MDAYEPAVGEVCQISAKGDPESCWVTCKILAREGNWLWVGYKGRPPKTESRRCVTFRSQAKADAEKAAISRYLEELQP